MTDKKPSKLTDRVYKPIEFVSDTLERKLGIVSVVIISLSAMLGSGLFVLPALAMLNLGGSGIWLAYVVAALVVLPGALSKSELATAMPTSGGDYIYIERTYYFPNSFSKIFEMSQLFRPETSSTLTRITLLALTTGGKPST